MLRSRLCQAEQKVGVAVRAFLAVLECVVVLGEELEAPLDSGILVPHFGHAYQWLVVGEYAEYASPKVVSEAFQ